MTMVSAQKTNVRGHGKRKAWHGDKGTEDYRRQTHASQLYIYGTFSQQ